MIEEPPVPNDNLGSLFDSAAWLYPRVWTGFALIFVATLLPAQLLSVAVTHALGLGTPQGIAVAMRAGAFAGIGLHLAAKALFFVVILFHHWSCMALGDAVTRGGEGRAGAAMSLALGRLPAQLWTMFSIMARLTPIAIVGGITAALTFRDSLLTAAAVLLLAAAPYAYFTLRWVLSSAVAQFEGVSGGAALRRSSALSAGRFWLISLQFIAYTLPAIVPAGVMAFVSARYLPAWAAGLPGIVFGSLVIGPFTTGMFLALYRREAARSAAAAPV